MTLSKSIIIFQNIFGITKVFLNINIVATFYILALWET